MSQGIIDLTYKIEGRAAKASSVYKLASKYYRDIVKNEAVLANVAENDHILCIGGGMCPFSAILFHQITGAKVTVIDNNLLCIPKARQVIHRLGLCKMIQVKCHDGCKGELDYSQFTVVHLALQVNPMEKVFEHIEKQVNVGTKILIRRPKKSLNAIYCNLAKEAIEQSPYISHKSRNIGKTILYTKLDVFA